MLHNPKEFIERLWDVLKAREAAGLPVWVKVEGADEIRCIPPGRLFLIPDLPLTEGDETPTISRISETEPFLLATDDYETNIVIANDMNHMEVVKPCGWWDENLKDSEDCSNEYYALVIHEDVIAQVYDMQPIRANPTVAKVFGEEVAKTFAASLDQKAFDILQQGAMNERRAKRDLEFL